MRERAYIDALAQRYSGKAEDRAVRDRAYADAMREVARRFPQDLDAATLFAEALMDLRPWSYWAPDGRTYGSPFGSGFGSGALPGRGEDASGVLFGKEVGW